MVQGTAALHHAIADALLPQADAVLHAATAPHAPVARLDAAPALVQDVVGACLFPCHLLPWWLLGRHEDCHVGTRTGQDAQILQELLPLFRFVPFLSLRGLPASE
jgi:hypothetical protein